MYINYIIEIYLRRHLPTTYLKLNQRTLPSTPPPELETIVSINTVPTKVESFYQSEQIQKWSISMTT
jgi:hypothetical protein